MGRLEVIKLDIQEVRKQAQDALEQRAKTGQSPWERNRTYFVEMAIKSSSLVLGMATLMWLSGLSMPEVCLQDPISGDDGVKICYYQKGETKEFSGYLQPGKNTGDLANKLANVFNPLLPLTARVEIANRLMETGVFASLDAAGNHPVIEYPSHLVPHVPISAELIAKVLAKP